MTKINLGSSNHPDNFVTEEEFADIVAEAKADAEETKARKEEEDQEVAKMRKMKILTL